MKTEYYVDGRRVIVIDRRKLEWVRRDVKVAMYALGFFSGMLLCYGLRYLGF